LLRVLQNVLSPKEGIMEETIIDSAAMLSSVAGDEDLLRELISLFWESCPRLLFDLQHAALTADVSSLLGTVHALKGMVSNFAARRVMRALIGIEDAGRQKNFVRVREAVSELLGEISRLKLHFTCGGEHNITLPLAADSPELGRTDVA